MSKNFKVNTELDFLTYVQVVDIIASEHFDSNGEYCPHIGRAYAMKLFYEHCVQCDKLAEKISYCANEIDIINILASDEVFMAEFENICFPSNHGLNFANAYNDALEIIEDKKSSINRATDALRSVMGNIVDKIAPFLTEENLSAVKTISKNMTGDKPTVEAIVENYENLAAVKAVKADVNTHGD